MFVIGLAFSLIERNGIVIQHMPCLPRDLIFETYVAPGSNRDFPLGKRTLDCQKNVRKIFKSMRSACTCTVVNYGEAGIRFSSRTGNGIQSLNLESDAGDE